MTEDGTSLEIAGKRIGASGTELHEKIRRGVGQISAELIEDRRRFHALAELGWRERRTSAEIVDRLAALGFSVSSGKKFLKDAPLLGVDPAAERPQTGCAAELESGRPGPTVCIRVDIDALPISEAPAPHRPSAEGWASAAAGAIRQRKAAALRELNAWDIDASQVVDVVSEVSIIGRVAAGCQSN